MRAFLVYRCRACGLLVDGYECEEEDAHFQLGVRSEEHDSIFHACTLVGLGQGTAPSGAVEVGPVICAEAIADVCGWRRIPE
jgi:hypothetical protein